MLGDDTPFLLDSDGAVRDVAAKNHPIVNIGQLPQYACYREDGMTCQ